MLVTTGLCGALSTFSTFSLQTVELLTTGRRTPGLANIPVTVLAGLAAVAVGWLLGGLAGE